jgi:hypothetical protein
MKRILALSLLAAFLGGCAVVPWGYGYHGDGYHQGYEHHRDNDYYRWGYGYHDHDR